MKHLISLLIFLSITLSPIATYANEMILAGGCFWCLEHDLEYLNGINNVVSGYSGGVLRNPTYDNHEGHQEVVLINYDESIIDFKDILRLYLRNIDPLDGEGQFCDRGNSYKPVIFFENEEEENKSKTALISASKELVIPLEEIKVELKSKSKFWIAEDYHQDFAVNNDLKYKFYRYTCGRDQRLNQIWGDNARKISVWNN
tara:strand:+ start:18060 stop:18662 length:603 start_codon:yes stop_codon:yes gene_type:complete